MQPIGLPADYVNTRNGPLSRPSPPPNVQRVSLLNSNQIRFDTVAAKRSPARNACRAGEMMADVPSPRPDRGQRLPTLGAPASSG